MKNTILIGQYPYQFNIKNIKQLQDALPNNKNDVIFDVAYKSVNLQQTGQFIQSQFKAVAVLKTTFEIECNELPDTSQFIEAVKTFYKKEYVGEAFHVNEAELKAFIKDRVISATIGIPVRLLKEGSIPIEYLMTENESEQLNLACESIEVSAIEIKNIHIKGLSHELGTSEFSDAAEQFINDRIKNEMNKIQATPQKYFSFEVEMVRK